MEIGVFHHFRVLGPSRSRNARGIRCYQLDLSTGHHVVALLQEHDERALHIYAARGEGTGLDRQQADTDPAFARTRPIGSNDVRKANSPNPPHQSTTANPHGVSPSLS